MGLTKFTEKLISDSFKTSISGSDNTESASFSSRVTLVEGGTTSKTLVSSSAQIATDTVSYTHLTLPTNSLV